MYIYIYIPPRESAPASWLPCPPGKHTSQSCTTSACPRTTPNLPTKTLPTKMCSQHFLTSPYGHDDSTTYTKPYTLTTLLWCIKSESRILVTEIGRIGRGAGRSLRSRRGTEKKEGRSSAGDRELRGGVQVRQTRDSGRDCDHDRRPHGRDGDHGYVAAAVAGSRRQRPWMPYR